VSTINITLNIEEISMSKTTPVTTRNFQKIRKDAIFLSKKLNVKLYEAQDIAAKNHGFKHWKQLTDAKKLFDKRSQLCQNHPVFFWDIKDIEEFPYNSSWVKDDLAVEICYDLLWRKPRISQCYSDRKEWLDTAIYTNEWSSFKQLNTQVLETTIHIPEYVFIRGCFIPFEELRKSSQSIKELESIETTLVIYDQIEPYLEKLQLDTPSTILDFSNKFYWDSDQINVFNLFECTEQETCDFVANMYFNEVILISPDESISTSVKRRLGDHLVHVIDLDF